MLHRKSAGQESIFSKREQILLVDSGINVGFGILFDDSIGDDDGTTFVGSANAAEEQPGKHVMQPNKLLKAFERWEM